MPSAIAGSDAVDILPAAFWVHRGAPPTMRSPHRHDDVEINVVLSGRLDYIFGGAPLTVPAGRIAVFWAATPHRLLTTPESVDSRLGSGDAATRGCWLHVPLSTVLGWSLPEPGIGRLLQMSSVIAPIEALPYDPDPMFAAWAAELDHDHRRGPDGAGPAGIAALLEIQAVLRRVFEYTAGNPNDAPTPEVAGRSGPTIGAVTAMAQYIVTHFREPVTIDDIAAAAHLNRTYAATIFSRSLGTTPGRYLTRCRVAEAQRLLITTDRAMLDIAHAAGFSSQSSFYDQFSRQCGVSPGGYRRRHG